MPDIWGGRTPFAHQRAALDATLNVYRQGYHGYLLAMKMGLGKTTTALAVLRHLRDHGAVSRCLIICPVSVMEMWRREVEGDMSCAVLYGTMKKRTAALEELCSDDDEQCHVAIINTEASWRMADELKAYNADMVILDESHKIKTHTSKQSKGITDISKTARFRLALTGTPVSSTKVDAFAQFRFLDERIFGKNFYQFRNHYCVMGGYQRHQVIGYKNEEEFDAIYNRFAFTADKDLLDLPDITTQNLYAQLTPEERRAYDDMRRDSVAFFDGSDIVTAPIVITRCLRMSEIAGGFVHDDDGHVHRLSKMPAKLAVAKDHIDEVVVCGKEKLVVFARFSAEVKALAELCADMGIEAVVYEGGMTNEEKTEALAHFTEDDECMVFIGNIQTAGVGIDGLQHVTRHLLYYSVSYNYIDYTQSESRLHRSGQGLPVNVARIVAQGTIDERVYQSIEDKETFAATIGDNWRAVFK